MESEIRDVLNEAGRLAVPVSSLTLDTDLYSVGLTSLATVNVMLCMEDKFDVEFPDDLLVRGTFQSIESLMRVVRELKQEEAV